MSSSSGSSIFMSYEGVTGEVLPFAGLLAPLVGNGMFIVSSCSFSASLDFKTRSMRAGQRRPDADAKPVSVSKQTDAASVALIRVGVFGQKPSIAQVIFVRTNDSTGPAEYLRLHMEGCSIIDFYLTGSAGDRSDETFSIHYQTMQITTLAGSRAAGAAQSVTTIRNGA